MKNDNFNLEDYSIAITGGYGHLGSSVVEGLVESGATVFVLGRDIDRYNEKFKNQKSIHFICCDISSSESIKKAFKEIYNQSNRIDVLINNACYLRGDRVDNMSDDIWNEGLEGVLGSVHKCIREVLPYFRQQGEGRIINVSSMYGIVAPDFDVYKRHQKFTNPPHYGAAKAGVIQLTKYFASLLGIEGVLVNCISPGPFPSKQVQKEKDFIEELSKKNALKRIGNPEELQGVFIFLSSKASTFITGQNITVDGGWTIM